MSPNRFLVISLLAFGLLGCRRTPPPSVGGATNVVHSGPLIVSFLIDDRRDVEDDVYAWAPADLVAKLAALADDEGGKDGVIVARQEINRGGQAFAYPRVKVGIKDLEAAAAKIDFGRVVALDPANRIVVVDVSAKPVPRPAEGWPGAKAVEQYVIRKTAIFAARHAHADSVKKFGRDKVVVVFLPDQHGSALADSPVLQKLRKIAPETMTTSIEKFGPKYKGVTLATVAPVQDVGDVVTALEGTTVLSADKERRVVLLGDAADLKP